MSPSNNKGALTRKKLSFFGKLNHNIPRQVKTATQSIQCSHKYILCTHYVICIVPDIVYMAVSKAIKISAGMESLLYWVEYRVSSFLCPHLVMLLSRQRAFPNRVRPEKADFPSSRLLSLIFLRFLSLVLTSMSPPSWQLKKNYFHSF